MPLLDILGFTGFGKTFYTAFIFLLGQTEEDYPAGLKILKNIIKRREIEDHKVIVTDRDLDLMKVIKIVFPITANLLCLWHINKNVLSYEQ
jgi:transposase-like protein